MTIVFTGVLQLDQQPDIIFITLHSKRTQSGVPAVVDQFMRFGGGRLKTIILSAPENCVCPGVSYPVDRVPMEDVALNQSGAVFDPSAIFGARAKARQRTVEALAESLKGARMILLAQPLLLTWLVPALKAKHTASVCLFAQGDALGTLITTPASGRRKRRLKQADHVFAASEFLKKLLVKKVQIHSERVSVTLTGTAIECDYPVNPESRGAVREAQGIPENARVAICSGPVTEHAGTDLVVEAWPEIERAVPDAWLILMGEGPEQDACSIAARGKGQVVCLGSVSEAEKTDLLCASDLYLRPNRRRTGGKDVAAGLAFLEAAMCGLPAVGGMTGAAPELVIDGETGLNVDGNSLHDIAASTIKVLASPDLRKRMSETARALAQERKGADMTDRLVIAVDQVLEKQGK